MGVAIYERLRDDIVSGVYSPGHVLVQEQVAAVLGTSRTPVRDALNRLTHEGLVEWNPGNGYAVVPLTDATISHVHSVRERLETLALSRRSRCSSRKCEQPTPTMRRCSTR
jgi:DNA-binding GntR family transcriptional regulator